MTNNLYMYIPSTVATLVALLSTCILVNLPICVDAFAVSPALHRHRHSITTRTNLAASSSTNQTVVELLTTLDDDSNADDATPAAANERIVSLVESLEKSYSANKDVGDDDPFSPLLGLYAVSAVLTSKPGENPVGGKWTRKKGIAQRLSRTRATYQHLLPANSTGYLSSNANVVAEAVNVISLEAFFGLIRLNVILRGDAIPLTVDEREYCEEVAASKAEERGTRNAVGKLSDLVVRAKFDPPRIVFGRKGRILNLNLGPRSSVVLDTTYCDNALRIGKGGTSGTKFVFKRLGSDDEEASEWRSLLTRRPLRKSKALVVLGSVLGWGIQSAVRDKARVLGLSLSAVASVLGAMFVFSSGGIEQDS